MVQTERILVLSDHIREYVLTVFTLPDSIKMLLKHSNETRDIVFLGL
jgi:hypothetical protein